jgi:hypothetical protein
MQLYPYLQLNFSIKSTFSFHISKQHFLYNTSYMLLFSKASFIVVTLRTTFLFVVKGPAADATDAQQP